MEVQNKDKTVVVIAGPTASGKTDLAINLALKTGGEVISADSMQIYRYMDIGTAKPTKEEMKEYPIIMIDIVDPDESYSVAFYKKRMLEMYKGCPIKGQTSHYYRRNRPLYKQPYL